ncbi:MAG: L-histidine N(alpha)-methyltransferase [Alphaproteobacteria bacterium]|nr:L-histidine N(alpha)-methyltransferase [Alphaproteobacteria bacterium]
MDKLAGTFRDPDVPRFRWTQFEAQAQEDDGGEDVIAGLSATPKTLPARYFYDDRGSILFERITRLPEYYLTRTELSLLENRAREVAAVTGPCELLELGSGSARKTRALIDAYDNKDLPLRYLPVDVSAGILKDSSRGLIDAYPALDVWALVGTYEQALAELPPRELDNRMAVFLGSTLGNLNSSEIAGFLENVHQALPGGSYFLVGLDLQKPVDILEAAYNDSEGVTAAFNLNMLAHLNERFEGDFDLTKFEHLAFYNPEEQQIEMHLRSRADHEVRLGALDLQVPFAEDETMRTEISRKFNLPDIIETFARHGFAATQHWTDPNDWFALILFRSA